MQSPASTDTATVPTTTSARRRTADRRALYRRSNTLSALPLDAIASASGAERRRPPATVDDLPSTSTAAAAELTSRDEPGRSHAAPARLVNPRPPRAPDARTGKRAQFCRKTSCNDLLLSGASSPLYPASATSGVVGSASGRLLTKVKERIRDTVLQTTAEWPVVVQERRQRASMQFEMQAARMMIDMQRTAAADSTMTTAAGDVARTHRSNRKSADTAAVVDRKEAARTAFRHRSVSCENTIATKLHPASTSTTPGCRPARRERRSSPCRDIKGIICSSKDLMSIIELSQQEEISDDQTLTSSSSTADGTSSNSPGPGAVRSSIVVIVEEPPDELSEERPQRPAEYGNSNTSTVYSDSTLSVSETRTSNDVMSVETEGSNDVRTTSSYEPATAISVDDIPNSERRQTSSKPPEVVFDSDGRTWEIYGAEIDPEVLGAAIQRHLQRIMAATAAAAERRQEKAQCEARRRACFVQRLFSSVAKRRRRRAVTNHESAN